MTPQLGKQRLVTILPKKPATSLLALVGPPKIAAATAKNEAAAQKQEAKRIVQAARSL
jgi:hypothetical protein